MACDVPPAECLHDHIRPKVPGAPADLRRDAETGLPYFTAYCPAHADDRRSLKIGQGRQRRIVWYCHAGCAEPKVRHALIGLGIHPGCLPRAATELRDLEEALRVLLTSDLGHADVRLRALAMLDSPGGNLPSGAALVEMAAEVHVSRAEAFRSRRAGTSPTTR